MSGSGKVIGSASATNPKNNQEGSQGMFINIYGWIEHGRFIFFSLRLHDRGRARGEEIRVAERRFAVGEDHEQYVLISLSCVIFFDCGYLFE